MPARRRRQNENIYVCEAMCAGTWSCQSDGSCSRIVTIVERRKMAVGAPGKNAANWREKSGYNMVHRPGSAWRIPHPMAHFPHRLVPCLHAVRPKMTPRFRRLLAVARGQAPRPGIVEDRSSSAHHHHRIRSIKTVISTFWHFQHPKSRGEILEIAGKNPRNRGEESIKSRGFSRRSRG